MSSQHSTVRRVGPLAASLMILGLVAVNTAAAPAGAAQQSTCSANAPVLELANPHPGDVLPTGDIVISGVAFEPAALPNAGISRVDLFLGSRDSGGLIIGSTVPANKQFQITAEVPNSENGGRDFVAYAYSSDGQEASVSVPVFIGAAPTATPTGTVGPAAAPNTNTQTSCTVVAPAESSVAALQPLPLAPTRAVAPFLQLANPSNGDVLPTGDVIIQGVAYDPAATTGSGVDRVELFLDSRDDGGTFLGGVVPSANGFTITAKVASTTNGGHTLVAYARSSVTGRETVVSVPLFVGAAPTPTPRPAS